jgi:hypothetical protein
MGYAGRKLLTGNPYEQFDEGLVPERALVYSAPCDRTIMLSKGDKKPKRLVCTVSQAPIDRTSVRFIVIAQ